MPRKTHRILFVDEEENYRTDINQRVLGVSVENGVSVPVPRFRARAISAHLSSARAVTEQEYQKIKRKLKTKVEAGGDGGGADGGSDAGEIDYPSYHDLRSLLAQVRDEGEFDYLEFTEGKTSKVRLQAAYRELLKIRGEQ